MKNSKINRLIKTFTKPEEREFLKFLKSPYHNTNKNLINLFLTLQKSSKEKSLSPDNESVYNKLFPGRKYDYSRLRVLSSELLQKAEQFLSVNKFLTDKAETKLYLLNELKNRKLDAHYRTNFREAENYLSTSDKIDQSYFLNRYKLYNQYTDYLVSIDEQGNSTSIVLRSGENLLAFFLTGFLNIAHELKIHEETFNFRFDSSLVSAAADSIDFNFIIRKMEQRNYPYAGIVKIYHLMFLAYVNPENDKLYYRLKKLIYDSLNSFNDNEKFNLYIILESICVTKLSYGKRDFYKELLILYKDMIVNSIYLASGSDYFQLNLFRNMFYTALLMKDFDWCRDFIENFSSMLHPDYREDMYNFALAHLNFEKQNYVKALSAIYKVNHDFFVFKYDARIVMLKIFFETSQYEQALSMIDSFSHYLNKNKKVPPLDKERFGNFLKYVKNLIKIRTGMAIFDEFEFKKNFETENMIGKKWIAEKYSEIKTELENKNFIWR
jgi:hypothetical protein